MRDVFLTSDVRTTQYNINCLGIEEHQSDGTFLTTSFGSFHTSCVLTGAIAMGVAKQQPKRQNGRQEERSSSDHY
jgi:hypothetical protein